MGTPNERIKQAVEMYFRVCHVIAQVGRERASAQHPGQNVYECMHFSGIAKSSHSANSFVMQGYRWHGLTHVA